MSMLTDRCDQLFKLGLRFNGAAYVGVDNYTDVNVYVVEMQTMATAEWDAMIEGISRVIDHRKKS